MNRIINPNELTKSIYEIKDLVLNKNIKYLLLECMHLMTM